MSSVSWVSTAMMTHVLSSCVCCLSMVFVPPPRVPMLASVQPLNIVLYSAGAWLRLGALQLTVVLVHLLPV